MKYLALALSILVLSACGRFEGPKGDKGDTGPVVEIPVPTPTPAPVDELTETINKLLKDENEYRQGLGQTELTGGLSCTLYTVTGGDRIQSSIAGHNTLTGISAVASFRYFGPFAQPASSINDGMNVLPSPLKEIYKNMYLLRCQGYIVVPQTNYYGFTLNSDDASVLYIGGAKVIDNDNNHGPTAVFGMKYLRKGVHAFRLDYAQTGGGSQALELTTGGMSIDGRFYAH